MFRFVSLLIAALYWYEFRQLRRHYCPPLVPTAPSTPAPSSTAVTHVSATAVMSPSVIVPVNDLPVASIIFPEPICELVPDLATSILTSPRIVKARLKSMNKKQRDVFVDVLLDHGLAEIRHEVCVLTILGRRFFLNYVAVPGKAVARVS